MAVDGVADLINHVQRIMWNKFNLNHQELRILFTMYRSTTTHSPAIVENARKIWREKSDACNSANPKGSKTGTC